MIVTISITLATGWRNRLHFHILDISEYTLYQTLKGDFCTSKNGNGIKATLKIDPLVLSCCKVECAYFLFACLSFTVVYCLLTMAEARYAHLLRLRAQQRSAPARRSGSAVEAAYVTTLNARCARRDARHEPITLGDIIRTAKSVIHTLKNEQYKEHRGLVIAYYRKTCAEQGIHVLNDEQIMGTIGGFVGNKLEPESKFHEYMDLHLASYENPTNPSPGTGHLNPEENFSVAHLLWCGLVVGRSL